MADKVNIGDFDQRITFQSQSLAADGMGGGEVAWTDVSPRAWANIDPIRAGESQSQGTLRAVRSYMIKVWRRSDIDESMRIVWRDQVMNIRELRRPGPQEFVMQIVAEAGVTQ